MKIDVSKLSKNKENSFKEEIVFDKEKFPCFLPLMEIKKCNVDLKIHSFDEFIEVNISLKADTILQCSYSLTPFNYSLKASDEINFSCDEESEDLETFKGNFIEMDKYIFDLISASIPSSPKAPNAKFPSDGKGYRVIKEEDFNKEKESGNSKFDALKDLGNERES